MRRVTPASSPVNNSLSPTPIDDGPWGLPALLRERRIVRIPALAASVERGRIRRIERSVRPEAFRQVGIGDEQVSERDQVRVARRNYRTRSAPLLGSMATSRVGDPEDDAWHRKCARRDDHA